MILAYLFHLAHFLFNWILLMMILVLHSSISIGCLRPLCFRVPKLIQIIGGSLSLSFKSYVFFILCDLICSLAILFIVLRSHDLFIHECVVRVIRLSLLQNVATPCSLAPSLQSLEKVKFINLVLSYELVK